MTKEYVEVFSAGQSAILNDFKELKIYGKGNLRKQKLLIKIKVRKRW